MNKDQIDSIKQEIASREKKYKVWYEDADGFTGFLPILPFDEMLASFEGTYTDCGEGEWYDKCLGNMTFLQFTGLKDKNGIEVFEGDILEADTEGAIVFYYGGAPAFSVYKSKFVPPGQIELINRCSRVTEELGREGQVIGNIFENPNLLPE